MATIREILAYKGSQVWSIGQDATVLQAAMLMNERKIGALVVLDQGHLAGMFTERDVLRRIVGAQRDPAATRVAEVMTADIVIRFPDTTIEEARGIMKNHRIRHLPIVNDAGELLGMISIGDLNAYETARQEQEIYQMHEYLYGRV